VLGEGSRLDREWKENTARVDRMIHEMYNRLIGAGFDADYATRVARQRYGMYLTPQPGKVSAVCAAQ